MHFHAASPTTTPPTAATNDVRALQLRDVDEGYLDVVPVLGNDGAMSVVMCATPAEVAAATAAAAQTEDDFTHEDEDVFDVVHDHHDATPPSVATESYVLVRQRSDGVSQPVAPVAPEHMRRSVSPIGDRTPTPTPRNTFAAPSDEPSPQVLWKFEDPVPSPAPLESVVADRGFTNPLGENNCFLNGILQLLWHCDSFRRDVLKSDHRACVDRHQLCVLCQLKNLFTQLKFANDESIPPAAVRTALALLYESESRFQLQQMDDAVECLEAILTQLHCEQVEETFARRLSKDQLTRQRRANDWDIKIREHECDPVCAAHSNFGMALVEQSTCTKCHASSEPRSVAQYIQFLNVHLLFDLAARYGRTEVYRQHTGLASPGQQQRIQHVSNVPSYSFGSLVREATSQEMWKCEECKTLNVTQTRVLLKAPKVLAIGLIWDSESPSRSDIQEFTRIVQAHLNLDQLFHANLDESTSGNHMSLKGMVCFYGRHYIAFQYSKQADKWMMFDDTMVKVVGPSIQDVWAKCSAGMYMPSVLIYDTM